MACWIDTHAHLSSEAFAESIEHVLDRARQAGVVRVVVIGTDHADVAKGLDFADQYPMTAPTAGIHPNNILQVTPGEQEEVFRWMADPRVVGVGETGLDRYWKTVPFELQQTIFARHLAMAKDLDKPVVIHCRDAEQEMLEMLHSHADRTGEPMKGVMHSFVGGASMAEECLALGLDLSFAGMVTFKKNHSLREVAAVIPLDRILVETDSPYLSPEPMRGKPNEPARVVHTGECLARVKGMSVEDFAQATTSNACRLFGIKPEVSASS
jgi:TatD DNase family protein